MVENQLPLPHFWLLHLCCGIHIGIVAFTCRNASYIIDTGQRTTFEQQATQIRFDQIWFMVVTLLLSCQLLACLYCSTSLLASQHDTSRTHTSLSLACMLLLVVCVVTFIFVELKPADVCTD